MPPVGACAGRTASPARTHVDAKKNPSGVLVVVTAMTVMDWAASKLRAPVKASAVTARGAVRRPPASSPLAACAVPARTLAALRDLTYGSLVLSSTAQASVYAWKTCRTCCSRALVAAAARRYGRGPFGIIAFAALSRECHAHRPCAETARGLPLCRCDDAGPCCGSVYDR